MRFKLITILLLLSSIIFAQERWTESIPIRQGVNIEWFRSAASVDDGVVYVWSDTQRGGRDLYAQKVDANGNILWNNGNPLLVDGKVDRQEDPVVIGTTDNSVVVAWIDYSNDPTFGDVYAQKISPDGELLWGDGVALCTNEQVQINLNIVPNLIGGAYVIWIDDRGISQDIYGVNLDSDGNLVNGWDINGNALAFGEGAQKSHTFWEAEDGGAVLAYVNELNNQKDIYATKFNADGSVAWFQELCTDTAEQVKPKVAPSGDGGFYFTWVDKRSGNYDIYGQKVDNEGNILWAENGVELIGGNANQENSRITSGGDGTLILSYEDRTSNYDIFVQKINADGTHAWDENLAVAVADFDQKNPRIVSDNNGGAFLVWDDSRSEHPNHNVYVQHIESDGTLAWGEDGLIVGGAEGDQSSSLARLVGDKLLVNWADTRNGSVGLYYQIVDMNGDIELTENGNVLFWGLSGNADNHVAVRNGNSVYFAWEDTRFGPSQIFVQKVNQNGEIEFATNGIPVTDFTGNPQSSIAAHKYGDGVIIAWSELRSDFVRVFYQIIDADGNKLFPTGNFVTEEYEYDQKKPFISEANGEIYIVWQDLDSSYFNSVYGQKIVDGEVQWGSRGVHLLFNDTELSLMNLTGNYVVAKASTSNTLYVNKFNPDGSFPEGWSLGGKVIRSSGSLIDKAKAYLVDNGLVVTWQDARNEDVDIYAQMIDENGATQWEEDGIALVTSDYDQDQALIVFDGDINLIYRDFVDGEQSDLIFKRFNEDAEVITEGINLTSDNFDQESADIVKLGDKFVVVWRHVIVDDSEIYAKVLDENGSALSDIIHITNAPKNQYSPIITPIRNDAGIISWIDGRSSGKEQILGLYAQSLSNTGTNNENDINVALNTTLTNYPNPFNPVTNIKFNVRSAQKVELNVYNLKGQKVKTLLNNYVEAGSHKVVWNGKNEENIDVSSGIYFYKLNTENETLINKMILLK